MAERITNKMLNTLLASLGFEQELTEKNNCLWRHPDAGTTIVLPVNKTLEPALQADLISIRARLDYDGHLKAEAFDSFVTEGRIPAVAKTDG